MWVWEYMNGLMEDAMKGIGHRGSFGDMGCSRGKTGESMMGIMKRTRKVGMGTIIGLMEGCIEDHGRLGNNTERGFIALRKGVKSEGYGVRGNG